MTAARPAEVGVVEADVPSAVYDEWRRRIVIPRGLSLIERGRLVTELLTERRAVA